MHNKENDKCYLQLSHGDLPLVEGKHFVSVILLSAIFWLLFSTPFRIHLHLCAANAWLHCHGQLQGVKYSLQQPFFSKHSSRMPPYCTDTGETKHLSSSTCTLQLFTSPNTRLFNIHLTAGH